MILNDGHDWNPSPADLNSWQKAYPAVNVESELRKMEAWSQSNPTKRKTAKGVTRFVNLWLAKAQDKGKVPEQVTIRNGTEIPDYGNFCAHHEIGDHMIECLLIGSECRPLEHLKEYRPRFNIRGTVDAIFADYGDISYGVFYVQLLRAWPRFARDDRSR